MGQPANGIFADVATQTGPLQIMYLLPSMCSCSDGLSRSFLWLQGRLEAQWLDETDCVGAWESDTMAAVVLATANTLSQLKAMAAAKGGNRLLLVVNPQWQLGGQIVSDFG